MEIPENRSLIPKPLLEIRFPFLIPKLLWPTKMNHIRALISPSKRGFHFDSGFPFLNLASKRIIIINRYD